MRAPLLMAAAAAVALGSCGRGSGPVEPQPGTGPKQAAAPQHVGETPMAERVAVVGLLNKRNGIVRNLTMKPGQALRVRDAIVRLRACETTAPWETPPLTGAFIQLDIEQTNRTWKRVFSGWLYKESPSLNAVEHPVYDVWPKSCTMSWPGAPEAAPEPKAAARSPSSRSSAKKSAPDAAPAVEAAPTADAPAAAEPEPIAEASNRT